MPSWAPSGWANLWKRPSWASTVSRQQTQGGSKSKRPKLAGSAPECNGGDGQESDEETGQPEDPAPAEPEEVVKRVGRSEWVFGKRVGFAHSLTRDPQGVGF